MVVSAQMALRWETDVARPAPAQFTRYHGDAFAFEPSWLMYGEPLKTNGMNFTLYWQTNGMANAWFTNGNGNAFTWLPEYDVGAGAYTFFIGSDANNYQANGILRMLPSPGFKPNTLPLPVAFLDFDAVKYVNAPWLLPTALDGYATELWVENYVAQNAPTLAEADPIALPVALVASNLAVSAAYTAGVAKVTADTAKQMAGDAQFAAANAMTEAQGRTTPQDVEGIIAGKGFVVNGQDCAAFVNQVSVGDAYGFPFAALNYDATLFLASLDLSGDNYFETWYAPYGIISRRQLASESWAEKTADFRFPVRHEGTVTLATEEWVEENFATKGELAIADEAGAFIPDFLNRTEVLSGNGTWTVVQDGFVQRSATVTHPSTAYAGFTMSINNVTAWSVEYAGLLSSGLYDFTSPPLAVKAADVVVTTSNGNGISNTLFFIPPRAVAVPEIGIDNAPTTGSPNLVTSGGVADALGGKTDKATPIGPVQDVGGTAFVSLGYDWMPVHRFRTASASLTVVIGVEEPPPGSGKPPLFNGSTERSWEVRVEFTNKLAALSCAWPPYVEWAGGTPEITVYGEYRFRMWTADGITMFATQVYPTAHRYSYAPLYSDTNGATIQGRRINILAANATSGVRYAFLPTDKDIVFRAILGIGAAGSGDISLGVTPFVYGVTPPTTIAASQVSGTKPSWPRPGDGNVYRNALPFELFVASGNIAGTTGLWGLSVVVEPQTASANPVSIMGVAIRPANELETKAAAEDGHNVLW